MYIYIYTYTHTDIYTHLGGWADVRLKPSSPRKKNTKKQNHKDMIQYGHEKKTGIKGSGTGPRTMQNYCTY